MPAATDSRTKRLLDLVVLLLDVKQPVPFAELREQFPEYRTAKPEAGLRAFERDKATLLELGVPLRWVGPEDGNDLGAEGGYLIDRQRYRLPEVSLSVDEVAALVVTASAARNQPEFPYRHAAELAARKLMFDLSGLPGAKGRRRLGRPGAGEGEGAEALQQPRDVLVHMPSTYRSRALGEHLEVLEEAIRHRKRVTIQYDHHRPAESEAGDGVPQPVAPTPSEKIAPLAEAARVAHGGQPSERPAVGPRDVDPYGLVYRQGAWLLVGHCHQAAAVRRFRIDRILDLKVAPRPRSPDFEIPASFSLQAEGSFSPWRFERGPRETVRLFVSSDAPWVAKEDFGPSTQSPTLDKGQEGLCVEFSCANLEYLVSRVLGAAGALRVLAPEALRRRIVESALQVARRNGGGAAAQG